MFRGKLVLRGGTELVKQLEGLGSKIQKEILKEALNEGAEPILRATRSDAPRLTGALSRSVKKRNRTRKGKPLVLIQTAATDFRGDQFYGGFIELGTDERFQKSGKSVGKVIAQHWMADAFTRNEAGAQGIIESSIQAGINAAVA